MKKQLEFAGSAKEAFVEAFFQLAEKKKINQITVREITNLAGYNRTTFYRHFEDVFALIEYAEDEFFQHTRRVLEEQSGGKVVYCRQFFATFLNCFREQKGRICILMSEQNRSHFIRRIRENITDTIDRRIVDTPRKRAATDLFCLGVFSAIAVHLQDEKALSDENLLDMIQTLFTDWYWPQIAETAQI